MSVNLWAYESKKCDGERCCGDCDFCPRVDDEVLDEENGEEE